MAETINLGTVTAYGAAVQGGYTGTYEEFCAAEANFANIASDITGALGAKADKVANATNGNLAGLDANGNIIDSGIDPTNLSGIDMVDGVLYEGIIDDVALKFSSDSNFTLSVASPAWDGTLEYSVDGGLTWNTWDGSQLSGTSTQPIYLRGTGNSIIAGGTGTHKFTFTGKYCTGNIENLLDYQTVANGEHPVMAMDCYMGMFKDCTSLIQSPELPATTLVNNCYSGMFFGCSSLTHVSELPATELAQGCYGSNNFGR